MGIFSRGTGVAERLFGFGMRIGGVFGWIGFILLLLFFGLYIAPLIYLGLTYLFSLAIG